ncbi:MAG: fructose-bisphosphatase class II family protein [Acidobacteriota bacterium]
MPRDQVVEGDLVAVTEIAAIAAAHTMGFGDRQRSERVAVEAIRRTLDETRLSGRIVVCGGQSLELADTSGGEDSGDDPPGAVELDSEPHGESSAGGQAMLPAGTRVGALASSEDVEAIDVAVYPLEGAKLCASGAPGAVSVLATAERGGLLHAPDTYMEKIIVGPTARGAVQLDAPVPENLRNIARAFRREVTDLAVMVLDRPRHRRLIGDIREAGARIRLIPDGDLAASIATAVRGTGVHAVMGVGGSTEGVIAAAALRCLGGEIQSRLRAFDDAQAKRLAELGFNDLDTIYSTEDLARGSDIAVSCTGVTDGELLRGVRFFGGGVRTSTLSMTLESRQIRFVDTVRREEASSPIRLR